MAINCQHRPIHSACYGKYLVDVLLDVHKARLLHLVPPCGHRRHILSELLRCFMHALDAYHHALGLEVGTIIGKAVHLDGRNFEPATRFEILVCLTEQSFVIANESLQFSSVDIVEGLAVGPGLLEIVDFEPAVGWDPGQVNATF